MFGEKLPVQLLFQIVGLLRGGLVKAESGSRTGLESVG